MATVRLAVDGMPDATTAARIDRRLRQQAGVFGAVASHVSGYVDIDFEDDEVSIERLIEIIRDAGCEASL
jgi:cation transport ATPase